MEQEHPVTPEGIAARIWQYIDDAEAVRVLKKYYAGGYSGCLFDGDELRSQDADSFTPHDLVAVATLSVPLSGWAVHDMLQHGEELSDLLAAVPPRTVLVDATDADLGHLFKLQRAFHGIRGIGHVSRSKLLAHKRPHLVPIRDRYVLRALTDRVGGSFTEPLRDALRSDRSVLTRLREVQREAGELRLPAIRALDVIVWMRVHGDAEVDDSVAT